MFPDAGDYVEILNSDAEAYGGNNIGNVGSRSSDEIPSHGRAYRLEVNIPPLAIVKLTHGESTAKTDEFIFRKSQT